MEEALMRLVATLALVLALLVCPVIAQPSNLIRLEGRVVDASGAAVAHAQVIVRTSPADRETRTDKSGAFVLDAVPEHAPVFVLAEGFAPVSAGASEKPIEVVLDAPVLAEEITVTAPPLLPSRVPSSIKTDTLLRDVPQAITVISREVISQQRMQGMADVVRYVPGVSIAQGEGNRDTPIFRGNSSTSDFYVDGVRDDVQYFRDLYNVERVEALKGPNAMLFGRGGVGGVLNRVTRQADWTPSRELTLEGGAFDNRRLNADVGHVISDRVAARVTGVFQESGSYRTDVRMNRWGLNPTVAFAVGPNTVVRAGYEIFHDDRTADRGIPSYAGRPVDTDRATFFGDPKQSTARVDVRALFTSVEHRLNDAATLRSRVSYGDYDKFYQNVFPGAVDSAGRNVTISAYNHGTLRRNLFSQSDLVVKGELFGLKHTFLSGLEVGRQVTDNFRLTGYFGAAGSTTTSTLVPLTNPMPTLPLTFRQSATDTDNQSTAEVVSLYAQDQVSLGSHVQVVLGARVDDFRVALLNNRTGITLESTDRLVSPRAGIIYKPVDPVSVYASYTLSYQPRAGEQLASLSVTNQALDPEVFENYEIGAKWDVSDAFELAAAIYQLDRGNVVVPDPANPTLSLLVDGQRSKGVELSAAGSVTSKWSIVTAYAYQHGEILQSLSATARAGARLAQLPEHSASLWNKLDVSSALGLGLGVTYRGEVFTSTDNTVRLPGFTRVDAALYYTFSPRLRAQINIENLFDIEYFANAHSNSNISPGGPRAIHMNWSTRF
jgi:catecholate siderophore receptor